MSCRRRLREDSCPQHAPKRMQGFEWETLPVMDEVHEDFNKEFGTDFEFPLRPKSEQ